MDYIDVYLMHNLGGNRTAAFDKYEAWEFMKEVKRLGHVRYWILGPLHARGA